MQCPLFTAQENNVYADLCVFECYSVSYTVLHSHAMKGALTCLFPFHYCIAGYYLGSTLPKIAVLGILLTVIALGLDRMSSYTFCL